VSNFHQVSRLAEATIMRDCRQHNVVARAFSYSALIDRTAQFVGIFPTAADDATVVPFVYHMDVLPPVSRHKRSLLPSPL
jgi:hypothetical protein